MSEAITSIIIWTMQPVAKDSAMSYIPMVFTAANRMEATANAWTVRQPLPCSLLATDKSGQKLVSDEIISPNACHNGIIYYNGTDKDHNLYALDTRSDSTSLLLEGNICYPVYAYDYIYYMDASTNYRLCRYSLSTGAVEVLTEDRVDTYNVGNGYVYYQKNDADAPALMRMEADGSNPEVVALGIYSDINLTSQYAYFHEFNSDVPMKRTPHSYIEVSDFNAAKQAAMASD